MIKIRCEVITPMFMYGADGSTPELRPSELKGMMRFWWRAVQRYDNMDKLRDVESSIFGGTSESSGKSKFSIRVKYKDLKPQGYRPLPHHSSGKKAFAMKAIPVGYEFDLEIHSIFSTILNDVVFNTFKVSFILGGFGKRSRRGFGSISCSNFQYNSLGEVIKFLEHSMNSLGGRNTFETNNFTIKRKNKITLKYPWIEKISFNSNPFKSFNELLRKVGEVTHKYARYKVIGSGEPRFASPVYVSTVKLGESYYIVVTKLHANPPFPTNQYDQYTLDKFVNDILALKEV